MRLEILKALAKSRTGMNANEFVGTHTILQIRRNLSMMCNIGYVKVDGKIDGYRCYRITEKGRLYLARNI